MAWLLCGAQPFISASILKHSQPSLAPEAVISARERLPPATMEGTGQIEYSAAALLDKAAEFLEQMNVELAFKFCERVLEREPHNPRALEMRGLVFLEQVGVCIGR